MLAKPSSHLPALCILNFFCLCWCHHRLPHILFLHLFHILLPLRQAGFCVCGSLLRHRSQAGQTCAGRSYVSWHSSSGWNCRGSVGSGMASRPCVSSGASSAPRTSGTSGHRPDKIWILLGHLPPPVALPNYRPRPAWAAHLKWMLHGLAYILRQPMAVGCARPARRNTVSIAGMAWLEECTHMSLPRPQQVAMRFEVYVWSPSKWRFPHLTNSSHTNTFLLIYY